MTTQKKSKVTKENDSTASRLNKMRDIKSEIGLLMNKIDSAQRCIQEDSFKNMPSVNNMTHESMLNP